MSSTRQLVIHHGDLGASHSANMAFIDLVDIGVVTCGSVMVPAPWFSEIAHIANRRPDLDIGVHLTLTSEFERFRWRPLTGGKSLVDDSGHFWTDIQGSRNAEPGEVHAELRAQIVMALNSGIDVTHLDSHMGTCWQPEFIDIYMSLGEEFDLPIVVTRDIQTLSAPHTNLDAVFERLGQQRNPEFQTFLTTPFDTQHPTPADYQAIFGRAEERLNWCGFHFAMSGDIELMTDDASIRTIEYEIFRSLSGLIPEDCQLVGMRGLRELRRR